MKNSIKILKCLVVLLIAAIAVPAVAHFIDAGSIESIFTIGAAGLATLPVLGNLQTSLEIKEKRGDLYRQMQEMNETAKNQRRDFSEQEQRTYDELSNKFDKLGEQLKKVEGDEKRAAEMAGRANSSIPDIIMPRETWVNVRSGKPVKVYSFGERMSNDLAPEERNLSLGKLIVSMVTGDYRIAEAEQRALSTGAGSGSVLVPEPLYASVIDAARAKAVTAQAGAKMVMMDSKTMSIARVLTDPAFEIKSENDPFTDNADMTFDTVNLDAYTIGTTVTMSRELAADSPNAATAIENAIVNALAVKLDQLALLGTGINEPTGINAVIGVQELDLLGTASIDYTVLIDLWTKLALANHDTTAFLLNPRDIGNLAKMRNDLGMNYIAPDLISAIKRLHSTSIPANLGTGTDESIAFAGDFTKLLWGVRQGMQLEISTTAGDAFKKHQVAIKCTWRGDFALEQPAAFAKAVNIANYPVESAG